MSEGSDYVHGQVFVHLTICITSSGGITIEGGSSTSKKFSPLAKCIYTESVLMINESRSRVLFRVSKLISLSKKGLGSPKNVPRVYNECGPLAALLAVSGFNDQKLKCNRFPQKFGGKLFACLA